MATTSALPTLRADAQRNHDRIVIAANEAFAEQGYDVSIEEIARRAGVGAATVYRRFPHKQHLLVAIFEARVAELESAIAAAQLIPDPWQALLAGIRAVVEIQAANMVFIQVLAEAGALPTLKGALHDRVFAPLAELFGQAQASGQLRADISPEELPRLIGMVAGAAKHPPYQPAGGEPCAEVPVNWERYLTLLTDALQTPSPSTLPAR
jgi:AcrR family transcriptional regulator